MGHLTSMADIDNWTQVLAGRGNTVRCPKSADASAYLCRSEADRDRGFSENAGMRQGASAAARRSCGASGTAGVLRQHKLQILLSSVVVKI
ncbi:hypothetical protein C8R32_101382 [Nitrosospira sp. Nsp5]|uniref:Uncharacterized protein n=1 Tax=Nitrosospira multiformis TaxID=1231 RepID=A0ABY0TK73_9PROT|nr:hypothetical protein C8R32_101382 [Nitrosospira sp. Nsp5]SDQ73481.1 hypothetical protein SAMN05216402_2073 [Nitrosospira multiformis]